MDEELERDDKVFLLGEEVAQYDGAYKVSELSERLIFSEVFTTFIWCCVKISDGWLFVEQALAAVSSVKCS